MCSKTSPRTPTISKKNDAEGGKWRSATTADPAIKPVGRSRVVGRLSIVGSLALFTLIVSTVLVSCLNHVGEVLGLWAATNDKRVEDKHMTKTRGRPRERDHMSFLFELCVDEMEGAKTTIFPLQLFL